MRVLPELGIVPKQTVTAYGRNIRDMNLVGFMLQGVACVLFPLTVCIRMM